MVIIRESTDFANDDLAIFPPINHENLYIDVFKSPSKSSSPSSSSRLSESSSSSSLSPSETVDKSRWKYLYYSIFDIDIVQGWWNLLLARILSSFKNSVISRNSLSYFSRALRSYYPVMFILIWWCMRNRTRRLRERKIAAHLRDTIKEKDERIAQLLHQIAQTNELLVKIRLKESKRTTK